MGLDMYLSAENYLSQYDSNEKEAADKIQKIVGVKWRVKSVRLEAAYWRKANAIHRWFVMNVQGGEDDCRDYYVSRENLIKLRDLCRKLLLLKSKGAAKQELPPMEGFFFGSTEMDEYYWNDLAITDKQLTAVLDDETLKGWSFYYQSSW